MKANHQVNYISSKYLPPKLHLNTALLWYIACDYFGAPGWVIGSLVTLFVIGFIGALFVLSFGNSMAPVLTKEDK